MRMGIRLLIWMACFCVCVVARGQQDAPPASSDHPSDTVANANTTPSETTPVPAAPRPDLTPDAHGKLSSDQMRELTRVVAQNFRENFKKERNYTFVQREVQHTVAGDGHVKSTEVRTYDVLEIYGEEVWRMTSKDDKPLDAKEAAKEDERIQKIIDKHKSESEDDRRKAEEREAKRRDESRKFVTAIADTHDFTLAGTESIDGRDVWVIDAAPRKGIESGDNNTKLVSKFRGRLWIDKQDLQLVKVDAEAVETASVGWVLARIHKGTGISYEQLRMDDEVWLPKHMTYKFDARVGLFKGYNLEGELTYRDYKKFRTSARIVGMGAVQDTPPQ